MKLTRVNSPVSEAVVGVTRRDCVRCDLRRQDGSKLTRVNFDPAGRLPTHRLNSRNPRPTGGFCYSGLALRGSRNQRKEQADFS